MDTNRYTATRSYNGKTISVSVERGTFDEKICLDGMETGSVKTHVIDSTNIVIADAQGKVIARGSKVLELNKRLQNCAQAVKAGCVGMVGDAFLFPETRSLIESALAEANAAAPKTEKQIKIEARKAQAEAEYDAWYNSPEAVSHRKLMADMDREDSDY